MKKIALRILALILTLAAMLLLFSCNSKVGNPQNEEQSLCTHSYEHICTDVCTICGFIRADAAPHDMQLTAEGTASLLSAGTVIKKCASCGLSEKDRVFKPLTPTDLGMAAVYIEDMKGSIPLDELQKADGEITVKYKYVSNDDNIQDFTCYSEIKIQGSSSSNYDKKNFTVKFFEDENLNKKLKVDLGWGKENKYCMKANYIDFSQARNIVAARMFAQVVETRESIPEGLQNAPNYGLIDGYPILVYINGKFHGVYTMNIPKDDWQFAMEGGEETKEALLMSDDWEKSNLLLKEIGSDMKGWDIEHCSTANDAWVTESFNKLIRLLNCGDEAKIRAELPQHLDIEAAIDNMIFTFFLDAVDNRAKNILWATYDGKTWIPSMYDMDGTFGIYWNGQPLGTTKEEGFPEFAKHVYPEYNDDGTIRDITNVNKMYEILVTYYADEVEARYIDLRENLLTPEHTGEMFDAFFAEIHEIAYISDMKKWNQPDNTFLIPYTFGERNKSSMVTATSEQLERLDAFFLHLKRET